MHELEVFCEMTCFDFKLPIFCTAFRGTRSRTGARPNSGQRPLLTESRFIFMEDLQSTVEVLRLDFREPLANFFLNSSCAAGSPSAMLRPGDERRIAHAMQQTVHRIQRPEPAELSLKNPLHVPAA